MKSLSLLLLLLLAGSVSGAPLDTVMQRENAAGTGFEYPTLADPNADRLMKWNDATGLYEWANILTEILAVDGTGSGIDADFLDGVSLAGLATAAQGALADSALQPGDLPEFTVGVTVDGQGVALVAGSLGFIVIPEGGTITGWQIIADAAGDVVFDVEKAASAIPSVSIVASAPPTLTASQLVISTTLTGWTTTVAKNDVLEFEITGTPATLTRATLIITIQP